jgi:hypothetical protein
MDSQLVNIDSDIKNAQAIKDTVLELLGNHGFLNERELDVYRHDYQVIIIKKSWWHNWKTIFKDSSSPGYHYKFVKIN